jgi:protein-S-isoprenylcysteine O-methyltransferase Ste14
MVAPGIRRATRVVSEGPYALVRHPLYLAAFPIWLSLALACWSAAVLAITVVYVIAGYLIYMRSEEEMPLANLGDANRSYRDRVGMLFPRLGRREPRRG